MVVLIVKVIFSYILVVFGIVGAYMARQDWGEGSKTTTGFYLLVMPIILIMLFVVWGVW